MNTYEHITHPESAVSSVHVSYREQPPTVKTCVCSICRQWPARIHCFSWTENKNDFDFQFAMKCHIFNEVNQQLPRSVNTNSSLDHLYWKSWIWLPERHVPTATYCSGGHFFLLIFLNWALLYLNSKHYTLYYCKIKQHLTLAYHPSLWQRYTTLC